MEHFRRKVIDKLEEGYSIRMVSTQFKIDENTIFLRLKELAYENLLKIKVDLNHTIIVLMVNILKEHHVMAHLFGT